jgi:hypothetical protein
MALDLKVAPDRNVSAVSRDGSHRGLECIPSESIVQYFLDVLSPVESKDLTDHLATCDLCSAKLLALEISAEISIAAARARSKVTIAGRERVADARRPARKPMSAHHDRPRSRRIAVLSVVALDDRELMTTMGLALDFEARVRVAEIEPFETAVTCFLGEPRRYEACGGSSGAVLNHRVWDQAIDDLVGSASSGPAVIASGVLHAAA